MQASSIFRGEVAAHNQSSVNQGNVVETKSRDPIVNVRQEGSDFGTDFILVEEATLDLGNKVIGYQKQKVIQTESENASNVKSKSHMSKGYMASCQDRVE